MPNSEMMQKCFIVLFSFYAMSFSGQENVFQKKGNVPTDQDVYNEGKSNYSRVLIVPFEPKMYISGVDRQISDRTGLTFHQIRDNMRYAIADYIMRGIGGGLKVTSLMHIDTVGVVEDLGYIYNSIGYKYKALPQEDIDKAKKAEEDSKMTNKIKGSFNKLVKKEEEKEEAGATIKDGQIHTVRSNDEKFMNTSIHNPNLLTALNAKYATDVFLFINELDIEEEAEGERVGLSSLAYKRKVKVHYTIFDKEGNEIHGGAAIAYMPSSTNDMNKIIGGYFPDLAKNISDSMPKAQQSQNAIDLQKEQDNKAEEQRKEIEKL